MSVRGSGGPAWRTLQALLPALAVTALAAWCLAWVERPTVWALPLGALAAGSGWLLHRPVDAELVWDGQHWTADGVAGRLDVMIDWADLLLLRLRPADGGRPRWLALTAAEVGAAWHGLRVAAYARTPDAGPPAASPRQAAD